MRCWARRFVTAFRKPCHGRLERRTAGKPLAARLPRFLEIFLAQGGPDRTGGGVEGQEGLDRPHGAFHRFRRFQDVQPVALHFQGPVGQQFVVGVPDPPGAVEAGSAFLGRFAGSVPAVDVINLPFFFRDETHLRAAAAGGSTMRTILDQAVLEETGAKVLWWQAFGRNIYLNKGDPIRTPADLDGQKVRTYGKVLGWTVEALGGAPTLMSGSKQFLAYQQGAVDVGTTGASAVKSRKLYEVMDNMTLSYDSAIEFVAVMNNDFFNSLSDAHQKIILDASAKVEQDLRDQVYAGEVDMVKDVADKINVVELTDAERAQWVEATQSVVDRFVKENGDVVAKVVEAGRAL